MRTNEAFDQRLVFPPRFSPAVVIGTTMSPMTTSTVVMVIAGLAVFGALTLYLGVKHGEYRTQH